MSDSTATPSGKAALADSAAPKRASGYARYVFWLMFLINMFNYVDRWVFTGLSPIIQTSLNLNNVEIGLLTSAFLIVYLIVAAPLGMIADRLSRKLVVGVGVGIWSLANMFTGLVSSFGPMLAVRSVLGIGEGSYYPAGTPLLAAYYPPSKRSQVLARWSVGALLGAGIGFLIAAPFSSASAWRYAFFFTGVPGLVLAVLILLVREKTRHEEDPIAEQIGVGETGPSWWTRLRSYLRIPSVRVIIALHALGFFGLTSLTSFLPIYLKETYGGVLSPKLIPIIAGALALIGGILGALAGGAWANWLKRRHESARILSGAWGFLLAAPCAVVAVGAAYVLPTSMGSTVRIGVFAVFALLAAFFLNFYNGPVSAALLDVLPPHERGGGGGLELALAHLLGDSYAAALVGFISYEVFADRIGPALLVTTPVALVLAGIVGIWGSRFYAHDVAALGTTAEAMLGTVVQE